MIKSKGFSKYSFEVFWHVEAMILLTVLLFYNQSALAQGFESYKGCFKTLPGWKAEEVAGMSMNYSGMNMVTANRTYKKGEKELQVSFISGAAPGMQTDIDMEGNFQMETSEGSIKMKKIRGKTVTLVYDKKEKDSTITVILKRPENKKNGKGAVLNFTCQNMTMEVCLELAKKFEWNCFEKRVNAK